VSLTARRGCRVAAAVALLLALSAPGPAAASPETITRATTNLLFGPFDIVLAPIVGSRSVYNNLRDIDDTMAVRVAYVVPGVAWNTAYIMGGGVLRIFSGLIEFVPGLFLIPFEADLDPLFAPPERSNALIWEDYDFLTIKLGINYIE